MHPPRFSVQDAERIPEEQEMEAPVSQSCHPCSVRTSGTQDTLLGRWWTLKIYKQVSMESRVNIRIPTRIQSRR